MATRKMKQMALKQAIQIARDYARGGSEKSSPDIVLDQSYKRLLQIMEDIGETPCDEVPPE
ncbi:hypothetical protein SAMN02745216_01125 [Desulfatibacillum alkenivorans DSM 16219]|uniref:Uncharacterized protein n=1 Tax=Desulfatibacillum alkenivorans DSM 16219 TaxID=1121393 RepID=A0A1M6GW29_9BACT|nr:hypothetical protein [Desulfatibacillum alkenivorans]SHJ14100.1 hypothetical protein SAMN02745216_01125 [Desulfatibacillum alkenivorans DSM 16219]